MQRKTMGQKIKETIFVLFLGILLAVGSIMIFVNTEVGHSYIVQDNTEKVSKDLTAQKADENKKQKTSYDATKTKSISAKELWRAKKYPASPIGRMSIPSVDIHNAVFEGFGDHNQNLSYGVVSVLQDRKMGGENNYNLAGHYMGGYGSAVLDNLHYMKPGDKIYVTDMHTIYEYTDKNIAYDIKPTQVEVEQNHGHTKMITLITCSDFNPQAYGYGQHRTVAQGVLTGQYPASRANLEKYELTDKVSKTISKKARKEVQPTASQKVYSKFSLKSIERIALAIWLVVMAVMIFSVWHTPKRVKRAEQMHRKRKTRGGRPSGNPRGGQRPHRPNPNGRPRRPRPGREEPMNIKPTKRHPKVHRPGKPENNGGQF